MIRQRWKKNLYENNGYPDNYTDDRFLEELKKNIYVREVTFSEAFYCACLLTQQLCLVSIFASAFVYLYNNWILPSTLILYSSCIAFLAYLILFYGSYNFCRLFRIIFIYVISSYLHAPVLKSLMRTVSTDSIYSMSVILMCLHLALHDYGMSCLMVSSSFSLNLAIFCSVCLVSRLDSYISIFAFMHLTVLIFATSPLFFTKIGISYTFIFILTFLSTAFLSTISVTVATGFILVVFFVNFICPYYFVKWHSYKDNIYGPWDEVMLNMVFK